MPMFNSSTIGRVSNLNCAAVSTLQLLAPFRLCRNQSRCPSRSVSGLRAKAGMSVQLSTIPFSDHSLALQAEQESTVVEGFDAFKKIRVSPAIDAHFSPATDTQSKYLSPSVKLLFAPVLSTIRQVGEIQVRRSILWRRSQLMRKLSLSSSA